MCYVSHCFLFLSFFYLSLLQLPSSSYLSSVQTHSDSSIKLCLCTTSSSPQILCFPHASCLFLFSSFPLRTVEAHRDNGQRRFPSTAHFHWEQPGTATSFLNLQQQFLLNSCFCLLLKKESVLSDIIDYFLNLYFTLRSIKEKYDY